MSSKAKLLYTTIIRKVESEKSYNNLEHSTYTFLVNPNATKTTIKHALEELYNGIKVESVRTQNRKGKQKRTRRGFYKQTDKKFAMVRITGQLEQLANMQVKVANAEDK